MQIFSSGPTSPDLKRKFLEASLLKKLETENGEYEIKPLSEGLSEGFTGPSAFTQGGVEVHGSHPLFYWTRSRGEGFLISLGGATVLLHYSVDMKGFMLVRPVGNLDAISDLVNGIAGVVAKNFVSERLAVRYCSPILTEKLKCEGWARLSSPLLDSAYADDETWPEVIIKAPPVEFPHGASGRSVREAITRHQGSCEYRAEETLLDCGELDFILDGSFRSQFWDNYEVDFNVAIVSFIKRGNTQNLRFHYLLEESTILGFGITGKTASVTHSYYTGVVKRARLTTYFFWKIYLNEMRDGAKSLNLGGSENRSLHSYKSRSFGEHSLRFTSALEYVQAC